LVSKIIGGKREKKLGECSELKMFDDRFMILDKEQMLSVWINYKPCLRLDDMVM
jgi:hypothetical protein